MIKEEDKGKVENYDQSDLLGIKPFGNIGPDRTQAETKVVEKLKKLRAKGSTAQSGEEANVGDISKAIGKFVNK